MVQLGVDSAGLLHNVALLGAYAVLPVLLGFGLPRSVALVFARTAPLALFQVFAVARGGLHDPRRWKILALCAVALVFVGTVAELVGFTVMSTQPRSSIAMARVIGDARRPSASDTGGDDVFGGKQLRHPGRVAGMGVDELFGSCDEAPVGHGRPLAMIPPTTWRTLDRHVKRCRTAGLGFNLLLNPICLSGFEENVGLERRIRRALTRAVGMGVTAVTVAHPWLVTLAHDTPLRVRVGVFVGVVTVEQARYWEELGAHIIALDTHVLCRDLNGIKRIAAATSADIELPVNIGCILRCPLARTHGARLSHASRPGTQPMDPCMRWCMEEKRRDPVNLIRSDFIRPEDLERYRALGVTSFKIVDRACSTDVLVERVRAYHSRCWEGDILQLIGPRGAPPRQRRLPVVDSLRHLGVRKTLTLLREARQFMKLEVPWSIENRALGDLILPGGCHATGCAECGHCDRVAARVVRPRAAQYCAPLPSDSQQPAMVRDPLRSEHCGPDLA